MGFAVASASGASRRELVWLDAVKAMALIWIIASHVVEPIFGNPAAGNPALGWPPFAERVSQFAPIGLGHGVFGPLVDVVRYFGWTGDNGVSMFLIASGFGLTYGLLRRGPGMSLVPLEFFRRRAARIYPLWWTVHLVVAIVAFFGGDFLFFDAHFLSSALGIRFTPGNFYYVCASWWYVGLLLQCYLVFPLLWRALAMVGATRLLIACCVLGFAARGAGLFIATSYLDEWSRGAIFVTRLPDFAFGVAFAWWYVHRDAFVRVLTSRTGIATMAALAVAGFALSFSLAGMIVAPFAMGAAFFALAFALVQPRANRTPAWLLWLGEHSYSIFLTHQFFIVPLLDRAHSPLAQIVATVFALVLGVISAIALERLTDVLGKRLRRLGLRRGLAFGAATLAGLGLALFAANAAVARFDPQEALGWGERASLQSDPVVGWKLLPSRTTRLRWVSYDYAVTANALGFPGPEIASPQPGDYRIMTTGDAFTSAEGVDTSLAWPRLLERALAPHDVGARRVLVANFAVTGYGPNQYDAVVREFAARTRPNLIVLGMFTNDYEDVLRSDDDFRASIGFGRPLPGSLGAVVRFAQLRAFLEHVVRNPALARLRWDSNVEGAFDTDAIAFDPERRGAARSRALMRERLRDIRNVARGLGARVTVALVPSPAQVCAAADLRYDDPPVRLIDPELPQRATRAIATTLDLQYVDLRSALRASPTCPYQPRNQHFTALGHRLVAAALARAIAHPK